MTAKAVRNNDWAGWLLFESDNGERPINAAGAVASLAAQQLGGHAHLVRSGSAETGAVGKPKQNRETVVRYRLIISFDGDKMDAGLRRITIAFKPVDRFRTNFRSTELAAVAGENRVDGTHATRLFDGPDPRVEIIRS
jgi:hypothetical protein